MNEQKSTHPQSLPRKGGKLVAFTLVEALIALVIIGVVSAMTLPSLLTTINNKVKNHQVEVFTRKFAKGTDLLNIDNGIGPYYNGSNPSYEFAQALSKHLKIVTICHSGEEMKNCFPDIVKVGDETVDITKITSGENFGLDKENYTDIAGIVLGDGTPMILSWNKNCPVSDPDVVATKGNSNQSASLTYSCVKGFYDVNGFRGPNKISSNIKRLDDVIGFNGTSALSETHAMPCLFELSNGKCLTAPPNEYTAMSGSECMAQKSALGLSYCYEGGNDYYAGAARACGGRDKIASPSDLEELGKELYGNSFRLTTDLYELDLSVDNDTFSSFANIYGLLIVANTITIFTSDEGQGVPAMVVYKQVYDYALPSYFESGGGYLSDRDQGDIGVICLGDK